MIYSPTEARKFCETLADAICPAWRKPDVVVMDSIPNVYDPQTATRSKSIPTPQNFTYWAFERQKGVGYVSHAILTWGEDALRSYRKTTLSNWDPPTQYLPVFIEINTNAGNTSVAGDQDHGGSSAFRLRREVDLCVQMLNNLNLWPRHPGYSGFRHRVLIHAGKKK